ncbi:MAG: glycosyltransferase family 4 protein [Candidatus Omnitrophica bacterium]|nr:glycosyltransferase family 4 protein [Candidatus Omnitrophota bacterium]
MTIKELKIVYYKVILVLIHFYGERILCYHTPMNVLLVSDVSVKTILGGAEKVLYEEAVFLLKQGHQVFVLTRKLDSHSCVDEIINGIHEFRYETNTKNPFLFLLSTIINAPKCYKQISSRIKFDVINFHQPFTALGINLLSETKHIRKVYICHSLSFEEYISRNPGQKTLGFIGNVFLRKTIEKFSLEKANQIIVLSQYTKNKLLTSHHIKEDKINIVPSGIDIHHFFPAVDKIALRRELNINPEPLTLFTVRNLVQRMGLENLIKTIPLVQQKGIPVQLFIGGQGVLKEKLQNIIHELKLEGSVKLCGFISEEMLLKYYQMADFFILPTIDLEGFGLVTLEAMSSGTPVLATPIGGTVEILGPFAGSLLFKSTSPEDMAQLIAEKYSQYKNNVEEYKKLCLQVRQYIETHYCWDKNAQGIEALLKSS